MKTTFERISLRALLATALVGASVLGAATSASACTPDPAASVLECGAPTAAGVLVTVLPTFPVPPAGPSWLGVAQAGVLQLDARYKAYQIQDPTISTVASSVGAARDGKTLQEKAEELAIQEAALSVAVATNGLTMAANDMVNSLFSNRVIIDQANVVFPGTAGVLTNGATLGTGSSTITSGNRLITTFSPSTGNPSYVVEFLSVADKLSIIFRAMFGISDADYNTITCESQESGVIVRNVFNVVFGVNRDGASYPSTTPGVLVSLSSTSPAPLYPNYPYFGGNVGSATTTASTGSFGNVTQFGGTSTHHIMVGCVAYNYVSSVLGTTSPAVGKNDGATLKALLLSVAGTVPVAS
jgi:hypothetical protein